MTNRQHLYVMNSLLYIFDAEQSDARVLAWNRRHDRQGFARADGVLNVGTILDFAEAEVVLRTDPWRSLPVHVRVHRLPLRVVSGPVLVASVDPVDLPFSVRPGTYDVHVAQSIVDQEGEERLRLDLHFSATASASPSAIVVADEGLDSAEVLDDADAPQFGT